MGSGRYKRYALLLALALAATPSAAVHAETPGPQSAEHWETSSTALPSGLGYIGAADAREFSVLEGFSNERVTVTIAWSAERGRDLTLLLSRLDASTGRWVFVDSSDFRQAGPEDRPVERVVLADPPPGRYRTLVENETGVATPYRGSVVYQQWVEQPEPLERSYVDRPDVLDGDQMHVLYFVPVDKPDEGLDTSGVLETSVRGMSSWFSAETGGRRLKFDVFVRDGVERLDITFVRGARPAADYFAESVLRTELRARGFRGRAERPYLVYAAASIQDGPNSPIDCGYSNAGYAMIALDGRPSCSSRVFGGPVGGPDFAEAFAMHSLIHQMVNIPIRAPHACGPADANHVCTARGAMLPLRNLDPESVDVMNSNGGFLYPLRELVLDRGRDDYYAHEETYLDLEDSLLIA